VLGLCQVARSCSSESDSEGCVRDVPRVWSGWHVVMTVDAVNVHVGLQGQHCQVITKLLTLHKDCRPVE
jgi:hypothetical protein